MASTSVPTHRVRFVDYDPSPITALQFTPVPLPSPDPAVAGKQRAGFGSEFGSLVVARQNGQVDVWEWVQRQGSNQHSATSGAWVLDRVLPAALSHPSISLMILVIRDPESFTRSSATRKVPTLAECRLFTSGAQEAELVERCLFTGRILQGYPVPAAPIWALSVSPTHDTICIASSSSSLHLISLNAYSSDLELASPIHRTEGLPGKVRTLSMAWGPPARTQSSAAAEGASDGAKARWEWKNSYLITGNSDGSARKWNLASGRMIGRMVVNAARKEGKSGGGITKSTIVWGVGVLADHTVITADSLGMVTFWDGRSQAQKQAFQGHAADAQCLVVGSSGRTVYTSGPDQKVTEFSLVGSDPTPGKTGRGRDEIKQAARWVHSSSKRLHVHDVRALAIWPPYSLAPPSGKVVASTPLFSPILASGGLDMQVVLTPAPSPEQLSQSAPLRNPLGKTAVRAFSDSVQRSLGFTPLFDGANLISFSPRERLIALRRYRGIAIWRLARLEEIQDIMNSGYEKVLEMRLEVRTQLLSSALSRDGKWLAVSDLYETKLFSLIEGLHGAIHPRRIKSLSSALIDTHPRIPFELRGTGSSSLAFSPDSTTLLMGLSMSPHAVIVQLPTGGTSKLETGLEVVKGFDLAGSEMSRTIRDLPQRNGKVNGHSKVNGNGINGHDADHMDVDDALSVSSTPGAGDASVNGDSEVEEDASSGEEGDGGSSTPEIERRNRARSSVISEDGQWGVVCTNGGKVMVFAMDLLKLHCVLPSFGQVPTSMTFLSSRLLVLGFALAPCLQVYDVEARQMRDGMLPAAGRKSLARQSEPLSGLLSTASDPSTAANGADKRRARNTLVGWGAGWIAGLHAAAGQKTGRVGKTKRARDAEDVITNGDKAERPDTEAKGATTDADAETEGETADRGAIVNCRFRSIIGVGRLGGEGGELVIVERPFMDLRDLPMAFAEKKYGT